MLLPRTGRPQAPLNTTGALEGPTRLAAGRLI
jgi:hypothetical protein